MKRLHQIIFMAGLAVFFNACNTTVSVPSQETLKIKDTLPKIELTKKGVVVDMTQLAFEWKSIENPDVEGIKIYKSSGDSNTSSLFKTIENRYSTHYVDLDVPHLFPQFLSLKI